MKKLINITWFQVVFFVIFVVFVVVVVESIHTTRYYNFKMPMAYYNSFILKLLAKQTGKTLLILYLAFKWLITILNINRKSLLFL